MPEQKTLQVITLGCSKNDVDTEHLLAQVKDDFCILPSGNEQDVDYLLLNTCGFIGDAKEESIQAILEAVERKKQGKIGKIFVFGCLSQRYIAEMPDRWSMPLVPGWILNAGTNASFRERNSLMPISRFRRDVTGDVHIVPYRSSAGLTVQFPSRI